MRTSRLGMIIALGALTAACGSTAASHHTSGSAPRSSPASPATLLSDASTNLGSVTSFRYSGSGTVSVPAAGGKVGSFTMTGAVSGPQHLAEVSSSAMGVTSTVIASDSDVYLHLPVGPTASSPGVQWYEFPVSSGSSPLTMASGSRFAAMLRAMVHPVVVGTRVVDGQSCTLLRATVSGAAIEGAFRAADPLAGTSHTFSSLSSFTVVATIAINAAHQPVQVVESVQGAQGTEVHLVLNFSDENQPVSITLPPSSEVEQLSSITGLSGILEGTAGTAPSS